MPGWSSYPRRDSKPALDPIHHTTASSSQSTCSWACSPPPRFEGRAYDNLIEKESPPAQAWLRNRGTPTGPLQGQLHATHKRTILLTAISMRTHGKQSAGALEIERAQLASGRSPGLSSLWYLDSKRRSCWRKIRSYPGAFHASMSTSRYVRNECATETLKIKPHDFIQRAWSLRLKLYGLFSVCPRTPQPRALRTRR